MGAIKKSIDFFIAPLLFLEGTGKSFGINKLSRFFFGAGLHTL